MELWNEAILEKSQKILFQLRGKIDLVIIGGWACWLYAKAVKSKDIDVYIDFKDFFKLQEKFSQQGIFINLNKKLKKYEAKIDEIDVDVYTPHYCPLLIPCKDVFSEKWFQTMEGFKVIFPEPLLVLKLNAEENRKQTIKGFKDRVDVLSLLYKLNFNKTLLSRLEMKYKLKFKERIKEIIKESNKEYSYFFPESDNLRELRKLKNELLKKLSKL
jgi:hypothetical protein